MPDVTKLLNFNDNELEILASTLLSATLLHSQLNSLSKV